MSDKILHKRSLTSGAVPSTSSLELGELAINVADGKIHLRRSGSSNNDVVSVVTANTITTGSITATSFTGSLFGTSSWASSASQALTASFVNGAIFTTSNRVLNATNAIVATRATGLTIINAPTGSFLITPVYPVFVTSAGLITTPYISNHPSSSYYNFNNLNGALDFIITGSISATNILSLRPQHPLPSGVPTGSFAVSASVPPKPFFWDGSNWNALY